MVSIRGVHLPAELVVIIARYLPSWRDLIALTKTSKGFYTILNCILYRREAASPRKRVLFWAAANNQLGTLQLALNAGIDPNSVWHSRNKDASCESYRDYYTEKRVEEVGFWSAMHIAAYNGHDKILELLLEKGGDPNHDAYCKFDDVAGPPLYLAISQNHLSTTELLLRNGASVHLKWHPGWEMPSRECLNDMTALAAACQYGFLAIAQLLFEKEYQTDVNTQDSIGRTPLIHSFIYKRWSCFYWLLLDVGADINGGSESESMLLCACNTADFEIACSLLDLGANPKVRKPLHKVTPTSNGYPPLHITCWRPWSGNSNKTHFGPDLISKLIERGADIEAHAHGQPDVEEGDQGFTPLGLAVLANNVSAVKLLIKKGARLDSPQGRHASVLRLAWNNEQPNLELVHVLFKKLFKDGALPQFDLHYYVGFLQRAASRPADTPGKHDFFKALLNYNEIPLTHEQLFSLLLTAARAGDTVACKRISRGLDPSIELDIEQIFRAILHSPGQDSLEFLARLDRREQLLKDESSVYRILNAVKIFSWSYPEQDVPEPEIVEELIDKGALCNHTDEDGWTALTLALEQECTLDLVRKLLKRGADPSKGRRQDETPLAFAIRRTDQQERLECVKILLEAAAKDTKFGIYIPFPYNNDDNIFTLAIKSFPGSSKLIALLLQQEDIPFQHDMIKNILYKAFQFGKYYVVCALLQRVRDLRASIARRGNYYLHTTLNCVNGKEGSYEEATVEDVDQMFSCLELLLGFGAKLDSRDEYGSGADKMKMIANRRRDRYTRGLALCFCRKVQLACEYKPQGPPGMYLTISPGSLSAHFKLSTPLKDISKRMDSDEPMWKC